MLVSPCAPNATISVYTKSPADAAAMAAFKPSEKKKKKTVNKRSFFSNNKFDFSNAFSQSFSSGIDFNQSFLNSTSFTGIAPISSSYNIQF